MQWHHWRDRFVTRAAGVRAQRRFRLRIVPPGWGHQQQLHQYDFTATSPTFVCADIENHPDSGVVDGLLDILIRAIDPYSAQIPVGTYPIYSAVKGCPGHGQFCAVLVLYGPTDPPGSMAMTLAASVDGGVTLTKVGAEYAGSFSATVAFQDGRESILTGTFDTTDVCTRAKQ